VLSQLDSTFRSKLLFTNSPSPQKGFFKKSRCVFSAHSETTLYVLSPQTPWSAKAFVEHGLKATAQARTVLETYEALTAILCANNPDAPVAALYLTDLAGPRAQQSFLQFH
jgi:hypothetical protein